MQAPPRPPLNEPAPVQAAVVERLPFRWHLLFLWLLFALLTSLLLWRLLPACGVVGAPFLGFDGLNFCRKPPPVQLAQHDELPQLNTMIADLELELARRRSDCQMAEMRERAEQAVRPPELPKPEPEPPKTETEKRIENENKTIDKLSFALTWEGYTDLDLAVTCPTGARLSHGTAGKKICGGKFEIDKNVGSRDTETPIEYVNWDEDPPKGNYEIEVTHFSQRSDPNRTVSYKVEVFENGKVVQTFTGRLTASSGNYPEKKFRYTR